MTQQPSPILYTPTAFAPEDLCNLMSDSIDMSKTVKRQKKVIYTYKGVNSSKEYNDCKYIGTTLKPLYCANSNRSEGRNRYPCNKSMKLQYPTLNTGSITQRENQYGNIGCEPHFGQMDLTDLCRSLSPRATSTLFSKQTWNMSRRDHTLLLKTSLNKFKNF